MEKKISVCEICGKRAEDEKQKRKEHWIRINGGSCRGLSVWMDKPRKTKKGTCDSFMLTVGFREREYDFCCIECLVKALEGAESI